jgi:HAD superfamily hydrolase (TIGR01509 family)
MMAGLTGVLVDMDGTLVDSEPYWIAGERALADAYGATWTDEDAVAVMGGDLWVTAHRLRACGVAMEAADIIEALIDRVVERMVVDIPWRPGAREFLASVAQAGVPQVLVTMSHRRYAEVVEAALPPGTFAGIVPGDEVVHGKPEPECFLKAAQMLGVGTHGLVVVEDSHNGANAGLAAGIPTVVVPFIAPVPARPGLSRVPHLADLTIEVLGRLAAGEILDTVEP